MHGPLRMIAAFGITLVCMFALAACGSTDVTITVKCPKTCVQTGNIATTTPPENQTTPTTKAVR